MIGVRLLKIFNRDGVLEHTSENVAGLEKNISWKPSGTLIAASQQTKLFHLIIFFEKNGLTHGQFKLPYKPNTFNITKLLWSDDSSLLLVLGYRMKDSEKILQELLFYSTSNYEWYLKNRIQFSDNERGYLKELFFDKNEEYLIHFITTNSYFYGLYKKNHHVTNQNHMLIIDGNKLLISDFQNTTIPPPLFSYMVKFDIADVQIKQIFYLNDYLGIILSHNILAIFKFTKFVPDIFEKINNMLITYEIANIGKDLEEIYTPIFFQQDIDSMSELLLPVFHENFTVIGLLENKLVNFDYNDTDGDENKPRFNTLFTFDFICTTLQSISKTMILISKENDFYQFEFGCNHLAEKFLFTQNLNGKPFIVKYLEFANEEHLIILTKNNFLYYDQILINSNVNSMLIFKNEYLLFTTFDSLFFCLPLNGLINWKHNQLKNGRKLERGSQLLAVSCNGPKVILELPRGNLEAFCPKTLLLNYVNQFIDEKNFSEAFKILHRNYTNLNYICDYNFDLFINNIHLFIKQLTDNHNSICLFLYELLPGNYYHILNNLNEVKIKHKLDTICNLFIETMTEIDEKKYLKPILLSHIKKENPEVAEALYKIKNLNDNVQQEDAIKFLLQSIDLNKLLEEALGTYDFDILLIVASNSNKDPKEYLALIKQFKDINDENYRKYKIDLHLQRYKNGLRNLSKCPDKLNEAYELIDHKRLYKEAIEIFDLNNVLNSKNDQFIKIWNMYGDYLNKKCYYEEAAIAYKRASNYNEAYKMYIQACNWNWAYFCLKQIYSKSDTELKTKLKLLSQNLISNGHHLDAAHINEHYLNDYVKSFQILVDGYQWERAIRLHYDYALEESLLENYLKLKLNDYYEQLSDNIDSNVAKIDEHLLRLKELLELSKNLAESFNINDLTEMDAYSDTSSICDTMSICSTESDKSTSSLKTNRSQARNRRQKKMEQKKYFLKKGSKNEDIQIIFALKEIIQQSNNLFKDGTGLVKILYDLYKTAESNSLQLKLNLLENRINDCIEFVWNSGQYTNRLLDGMVLFLIFSRSYF